MPSLGLGASGLPAALRDALSPLALVCALLVVARAVDSVLYYRIAFILAKYLWFFSSVVYPIGYCVAIAPIVALRYRSGALTRDALRTPWAKFAVMALLDQSYNLLSTWPLTTIGGASANVLTQLTLPVNLGLAAWLLGTRYRWQHYAGASLAVAGCVIQVVPAFLRSDGGGASGSPAAVALWTCVMAASALPYAGSNVYKEARLKEDAHLDVFYTNLIVGGFQAVIGLASIPTVALPFTPDSVPLADLGAYMHDAARCTVGIDPAGGDSASAKCTSDVLPAAALFAVYMGECARRASACAGKRPPTASAPLALAPPPPQWPTSRTARRCSPSSARDLQRSSQSSAPPAFRWWRCCCCHVTSREAPRSPSWCTTGWRRWWRCNVPMTG